MTRRTGGCQCGAIRYAVEGDLGRASICHCRMCQKAMGGFFGAFVDAPSLVWTRGAPAHFQSSNKVARGFCSACGTPLTVEWEGAKEVPVNVAISTFDDPSDITPAIQVGIEGLQPWVNHIAEMPIRPSSDAPWQKNIVSNQHPDHDTEVWPPAKTPS
ncbi:MAG: GFA family protein [Caulobacteraceae bacterium]